MFTAKGYIPVSVTWLTEKWLKWQSVSQLMHLRSKGCIHLNSNQEFVAVETTVINYFLLHRNNQEVKVPHEATQCWSQLTTRWAKNKGAAGCCFCHLLLELPEFFPFLEDVGLHIWQSLARLTFTVFFFFFFPTSHFRSLRTKSRPSLSLSPSLILMWHVNVNAKEMAQPESLGLEPQSGFSTFGISKSCFSINFLKFRGIIWWWHLHFLQHLPKFKHAFQRRWN